MAPRQATLSISSSFMTLRFGLPTEIGCQAVPEFEHHAGGSRAPVQIGQRLEPNLSARFRRGLAFHL